MSARIGLRHLNKGRVRRLSLIVLAVVVSLTAGLASAHASPLLWQSPVPFDRNPPFVKSEPLTAVSCPTVSACLAFSIGGHVLSSVDPTEGSAEWSTTTVADRHGAITAASCPGASLCIAVDETGDIISSTEPMARNARWKVDKVDRAANELTAVSCPSLTLCVAADDAGNVLTSTDPAGAPSGWRQVHIEEASPDLLASRGLIDISCPTTGFCAGVDLSGNVFTSTNPTAGAWQRAQIEIPGEATPRLDSISCPSAALCVAGGGGGSIATSTNPTGGTSAWGVAQLPIASEVRAISCTTDATCVAGGDEGQILDSSNPTGGRDAWTITRETGAEDVLATSCPSSSLCLVVDGFGHVLTSTTPGHAAGWSASLVGGYNAPTGVACTSTSLCVVTDVAGNVATTTSPAAARPVWRLTMIDPENGLNAISCARSLCVAVDKAGKALSSTTPTSGSAWHGAVIDEGHSLTAISCPTSSMCAAVDDAGGVLTSSDPDAAAPSWRRAAVEGGHALLAISCPTHSFCLATDDAGDVLASGKPRTTAWKITQLHLPPVFERSVSGSEPSLVPANVTDVSCPSASMCAGVAADGLVIASRHPARGAAWTRAQVGYLSGISCPSISLCVAVDSNGGASTSTSPTGGSDAWTRTVIDSEAIMNFPGTLTAIGCASTSFCLTTTYFGNALIGLGGTYLRALLRRAIEPASHTLGASAALRHGFSSLLQAPATGSFAVRWLLPRAGRHGRKTRQIEVASGHAQLQDHERATIRLALSPQGIAAIKRGHRLDLKAIGVLTPQGGRPVRVTGTFVVNRR